MASVSVMGPYQLSADEIAEIVTERSAGSFVLGWRTENGTFKPLYVGRSDVDVRRELEFHVRLIPDANSFTFRYASTPREAFMQNCYDFHECGGCESLDNKKHPTRPNHIDWLCPVCNDRFLKPSQS